MHFNRDVYPLPMDNVGLLQFNDKSPEEPSAFYRGYFDVEIPADTFLRTDDFTKGFVLINGFNLGRYWKIGPQKTLYVPASVLKNGKNEIIIFESDAHPDKTQVEFVDKPDLG